MVPLLRRLRGTEVMTINWVNLIAGIWFGGIVFFVGFCVGVISHSRHIRRITRDAFMEEVEREES